MENDLELFLTIINKENRLEKKPETKYIALRMEQTHTSLIDYYDHDDEGGWDQTIKTYFFNKSDFEIIATNLKNQCSAKIDYVGIMKYASSVHDCYYPDDDYSHTDVNLGRLEGIIQLDNKKIVYDLKLSGPIQRLNNKLILDKDLGEYVNNYKTNFGREAI